VPAKTFGPRNPLLVIFWALGLFVLAHTTQYLYFWLASSIERVSFDAIAGGKVQTPLTHFIRGLVGALVGIPITLLLVKHLWRRDRDWMRFTWDGKRLLHGVVFGASAVGLVVVILALAGVARVERLLPPLGAGSLARMLVGALGWSFFVAILEELVFRGMMTRELALRWGWPVASVAAGLVFSAVHLPVAAGRLTPLLGLSILLAGVAASVLFTALYVRSRSLGLAIGFHGGWNFALSGLLGTTMSGQDRVFAPWRTVLTGHPLWTGGVFGVESSVVCFVVIITLTIVVITVRRGDGRSFLPAQPPT
jgi:uncharacterized protein